MNLALAQAKLAIEYGETPVGAIIVNQHGRIIAKAHNLTKSGHNATLHAEMRVINEACTKLKAERLSECDIYVSLEPCAMCAAAISFARLRRLYFAAYDKKGGAVIHGARFFSSPQCHHSPEIIAGLHEEHAASLLSDFFKQKR